MCTTSLLGCTAVHRRCSTACPIPFCTSTPGRVWVRRSTGELARGLLLAKLWTSVELLHEHREDPGLLETQQWLRSELPAWLDGW